MAGAKKGPKADNSNSKLVSYLSVVLLIFGMLSLFLAQSAYWINHTVFNQANFSSITTEALLTESSRNAIASSVVNKSLEDRPIAKKLVGERAESIISGLLGSDLSNQAVEALAKKAYAYTTSSDRQDIAVDLTTIKAPVQAILEIAQRDNEADTNRIDRIPDSVVLVESSSFPDLSGFVKTMLWLGPLLWLGFFVSIGLYIYLGRKSYAKRVYIAGASVIAVAVIGILTIPFIPSPIAAAIPNIDLRPVAESLALGFLEPFRSQMYSMMGITAVILLAFSLRFKAIDLVKTAEKRIVKNS